MLFLKGENGKAQTLQHILNETDSLSISYDSERPYFNKGLYINSDETEFEEFVLNLNDIVEEEFNDRACDIWDYIIIYTNCYEENFRSYAKELSDLTQYCVCVIVAVSE